MRIVLASGNQHKCEEISRMLPAGFRIETQTALGVTEVEETGLTFVENAIIKARHAAHATGLPAIADDSGLSVDYLGGAPGIYSRRYAGAHATDHDNNQKLLDALKGVAEDDRTARFHCVIAFMKHARDPTPIIATGAFEGVILTAPRGTQGFGYDPIFFVPSLGRSVAELSPAEKEQFSHRGIALRQFVSAITAG